MPSELHSVLSGVSQGTALGPILFFVFFNDLPEYVHLGTKLITDYLILYHSISTHDDGKILQDDHDKLALWEDKWDMKLHTDKCEAIHISRSNSPTKHQT